MNIDALLQPITDDAPCGVDMSFSNEFDAVQEMRRADDASLPQGEFVTDLKVADWQGAADLCEQLLKTRSKDLRVAGWLVESWSHLRGFAGLADGLSLVDQLCSRFWAQVHPLPEDGEQELRVGNLAWLLGRAERLSQNVALLRSETGSICLVQCVTEDGLSTDEVARIQRETPRAFLTANVAEAGRALEALNDLQATVDELLGANGPGFVSARNALETAARAAKRFAREGGALESARPQVKEEAAKTVVDRVDPLPTSAGGLPQTRTQALQQLRSVAEFFRRTEPHSPVAYLADKAAQWGDMPLHAWLRAVVKDSTSLTQLEDLLGIKSSTEGSAGS